MFDGPGRDTHLADEEILQFVDGEASDAAAERARAHCAVCPACQTRRSRLEETLAEFSEVYRLVSDKPITQSGVESRARLKTGLAAAAQADKPAASRPYFAVAMAAAALCVIALYGRDHLTRMQSSSIQAVVRLRPDMGLTPGVTRPVELNEICSAQDGDLDPAVPASLQKTIFQEYGMNDSAAKDYQVDYLINPQLGGTNDLRNLWPEPYGSKVWNARVKDELEDRLHVMVCNRQIDLESAQREIATDWIAAYKKYFRTVTPG